MEQRALFNDFPNFMYNNMANKAIVDLGYDNMIDAINDFKEGKLPQLHDILSSNAALADDSTPLRQPISKEDWLHFSKVYAQDPTGMARSGFTPQQNTSPFNAGQLQPQPQPASRQPLQFFQYGVGSTTVGGDENSQ